MRDQGPVAVAQLATRRPRVPPRGSFEDRRPRGFVSHRLSRHLGREGYRGITGSRPPCIARETSGPSPVPSGALPYADGPGTGCNETPCRGPSQASGGGGRPGPRRSIGFLAHRRGEVRHGTSPPPGAHQMFHVKPESRPGIPARSLAEAGGLRVRLWRAQGPPRRRLALDKASGLSLQISRSQCARARLARTEPRPAPRPSRPSEMGHDRAQRTRGTAPNDRI